MARIRTIKPEFWTSEQVVDCSPTARLLFIGLWNFSDDHGIHPYSPKTIKFQILPGDDFTTADIEHLLSELISTGLIKTYHIEDKRYILITGWHHQKIEKPSYKHPLPDKFDDHSPTIQQPLADGPPAEWKGMEGKGKERSIKGSFNHHDEKHLPVDNSKDEKQPVKETEKKKPGRWTTETSTARDELLADILDRYGMRYHGRVMAWVRANLSRCNPDAMVHCLQRLVKDRLAGKPIQIPEAWLEAALNGNEKHPGENGSFEARESEQIHQNRMMEEAADSRKLAAMIGGIGRSMPS